MNWVDILYISIYKNIYKYIYWTISPQKQRVLKQDKTERGAFLNGIKAKALKLSFEFKVREGCEWLDYIEYLYIFKWEGERKEGRKKKRFMCVCLYEKWQRKIVSNKFYGWWWWWWLWLYFFYSRFYQAILKCAKCCKFGHSGP